MRKTIMWVSVVALAATGCHKASSDSRVNVASGVRSDSAGNNIIVRPVAEFVSVVVGDGIEITDLNGMMPARSQLKTVSTVTE